MWLEDKLFEIRDERDRKFSVGDQILSTLYYPEDKIYGNRRMLLRITCKYSHDKWIHVPKGICVMGVKILYKETKDKPFKPQTSSREIT